MDLAVWRDISLMWLIFLTLIAVLPIGVILVFAVRGMNRLRQLVKRFLPIVQGKARQVAGTADRISAQVAAPVIGAQARAAQLRAIRKATFRRKQA